MTLSRFAAVQWLLFIAVVTLLTYLLSPILTPFVAAAVLAYICNPLVNRLEKCRLPRTLAVLVVMLGLLAVLVLLLLIVLPLLEKELALFMQRLPDALEAVRVRVLPYLQQTFGLIVQWDSAAMKDLLVSHWQSVGGVAGKLLPWLSSGGGVLVGVLLDMLLLPVAMFYLLRDWNELMARVDGLVPRHWHDKVSEIAREVDTVLSEFLRGQLSVMLLMSVYYSIALYIAGVQFALPIGIVAGLLVFVPYLGMIVGLALATLAAAMQFSEFGGVLWVWAVFAIGHLFESMLITPWLVGERVGLHPLAVIFALLAFGHLFGFFGILLALPLSAILLVALRHGRAWYLGSEMYRQP